MIDTPCKTNFTFSYITPGFLFFPGLSHVDTMHRMDIDHSSGVAEKLQRKKNRILRIIRREGTMGRLDVARAIGISNSRVCDLIAEMLGEGILLEKHTGPERRGRRGVPLRVNPDYGYFLGFDMEALRLRMVTCDFAGHVIDRHQQKLGRVTSRQKLLDRLLDFITAGAKENGRNRKILGIGLAAAGVIDTRRGTILHYDMLEAACDLPLRDLVASHTTLPCWMEDNINALTIAEWMDGAARGLESFICFAVRSGIGAGVFLNGQLYTGHRGLAGEVGYSVIPSSAPPAQWNYLQKLVSERALDIDIEAGDAKLRSSSATRAGELLGAQLASIAALLDVQALVLAGGLIQPEGPLYDSLLRAFRRFILSEIGDNIQILPAQLGPYAAAMGAAHRCFQKLYPLSRQPKETCL